MHFPFAKNIAHINYNNLATPFCRNATNHEIARVTNQQEYRKRDSGIKLRLVSGGLYLARSFPYYENFRNVTETGAESSIKPQIAELLVGHFRVIKAALFLK